MIDNSIHKEFLNFLIAGNRSKSSEVVFNLLINGVAVEDIYENVIKKALYDIGGMWECGKISVATEHLASAVVETILNELYLKVISNNRINKTVVAACVEKEFHQIGIKMVADVFEMNGWNAFFLGANVPTNDLISFIGDVNPDLIALSLTFCSNLLKIETIIQSLRGVFPELLILVGGQAFRYGGCENLIKYKNVVYLSDLYKVKLLLEN